MLRKKRKRMYSQKRLGKKVVYSLLLGNLLMSNFVLPMIVHGETINPSETEIEFFEESKTELIGKQPTLEKDNVDESVVAISNDEQPEEVNSETIEALTNQNEKNSSLEENDALNSNSEKETKNADSLDEWMPDGNLQRAVAKKLKIDVSELTKEQMSRIGNELETTQIDVFNVTSLKGLEYIVIKSGPGIVINARDGLIDDLLPLQNVRLAQLNIDNNNVSDLSPLSNQVLSYFSAENNNIEILNSLNFSEMEVVNVEGNHISDISMVPKSVGMLVARFQTITNPSVPKEKKVTINTVKHVTNYDFKKSNFEISQNGVFNNKNYQNEGYITWENYDLTIDELQYEFDRQYSFSTDSGKENKVYYSGKVIQPLEGKEEAASLVVTYEDETGESLSDSKVVSGNVGDSYDVSTSEYKLEIAGYTFKETKGDVQGVLSAEEQKVTYVYTKNPEKAKDLVVTYEDEVGKSLSESKKVSGNIGDAYDVSTPEYKLEIAGYSFKEVKGDVQGVLSAEEQKVTYVYTKNPEKAKDLVVTYEDEAGKYLSESKKVSGNVGDSYDVSTSEYKLEIAGYTFKETEGDVQGVLSSEDQKVTYVYTKNPEKAKDLVVTYEDEVGKYLLESKKVSGKVGDAYDVSTPEYKLEIAGYTFKKVKGDVQGVLSSEEQKVTYVYQKDVVPAREGKIIIKYLDKNTKKEITKPLVLSGKIESDFFVDPLKIKGYSFDKESSDQLDGKYSEKDQQITLFYTKNIDQDDEGNKSDFSNTDSNAVNKKNQLPRTGEIVEIWISILGMFMILGIYFKKIY